MKICEWLLPEFDHEMASTRKVLERVPDDKFDWTPHAKSATMGWQAQHLANLAGWTTIILTTDSLDFAPPGGEPFHLPQVNTREELLAIFDKNVAESRATIAATSDDAFMQPWSLLHGGKTIFTMPRVAVIRNMMLNHLIHHRAQLTVYFRLNDIPVPAIYGPSADESGM